MTTVTPKFDMPRDMSRYSSLEAAMLGAIHAVGLPQPEPEYRFDWCCPHPKGDHIGICIGCDANTVYTVSGDFNEMASAARHEYRHGRAWRFDFAWPDRMVAVECEGVTSFGAIGRHQSAKGYEADTAKYSEAALRGWVVLRFSQRQINSGQAIEMVERALRDVTEVEA